MPTPCAALIQRLSAEQGDRDGQCCLGVRYASGASVERDEAESVKWLRRAAEQGPAPRRPCSATCTPRARPASAGISWTPTGGTGWPPGRTIWSTLQEELDRLAEGMTAAQVSEAKLAADTCLATYQDS